MKIYLHHELIIYNSNLLYVRVDISQDNNFFVRAFYDHFCYVGVDIEHFINKTSLMAEAAMLSRVHSLGIVRKRLYRTVYTAWRYAHGSTDPCTTPITITAQQATKSMFIFI